MMRLAIIRSHGDGRVAAAAGAVIASADRIDSEDRKGRTSQTGRKGW